MLMHPSFLSVIEGTNKGLLFAGTQARQSTSGQARQEEEQRLLRRVEQILEQARTKRDYVKQAFVGGESDWSKRGLLADLLLEAAQKGFPLVIAAIKNSAHSPHYDSVWLKAYDIMIDIQQENPSAFAKEYGWNASIILLYSQPLINQTVANRMDELYRLKEENVRLKAEIASLRRRMATTHAMQGAGRIVGEFPTAERARRVANELLETGRAIAGAAQ